MSETGETTIALPERARALLGDLLRERERVSGLLDAALAGVRAALAVPDGWVLESLESGFAPPPAPQANGEAQG